MATIWCNLRHWIQWRVNFSCQPIAYSRVFLTSSPELASNQLPSGSLLRRLLTNFCLNSCQMCFSPWCTHYITFLTCVYYSISSNWVQYDFFSAIAWLWQLIHKNLMNDCLFNVTSIKWWQSSTNVINYYFEIEKQDETRKHWYVPQALEDQEAFKITKNVLQDTAKNMKVWKIVIPKFSCYR